MGRRGPARKSRHCAFCGKRLSSPRNLRAHLAAIHHAGDMPLQYMCPAAPEAGGCNRRFASAYRARRHFVEVHCKEPKPRKTRSDKGGTHRKPSKPRSDKGKKRKRPRKKETKPRKKRCRERGSGARNKMIEEFEEKHPNCGQGYYVCDGTCRVGNAKNGFGHSGFATYASWHNHWMKYHKLETETLLDQPGPEYFYPDLAMSVELPATKRSEGAAWEFFEQGLNPQDEPLV